MKNVLDAERIHLESKLNQIRSLGLALASIATMECQDPDPLVIADLGRMVASTSENVIDYLEAHAENF